MIDPRFVTTAQELSGYRVASNLGIVRGIVVRSRSVIGQFGAGIQSMFGGNITIYTELCEKARLDAYTQMCQHAAAVRRWTVHALTRAATSDAGA